jgi:hypothetical protein
MDFPTAISIFASVVLAVAGFLFSYFYNLRLEGKKSRLEWINRQLNNFYGPLLSIVRSNEEAWTNFISKHNNNPNFYKKKNKPTPEQLAEFHHWMTTVFIPNNERLYEIIVSETSLIEGDEIPTVLLTLLAHLLEFKIEFHRREDEHAEVGETKSKYPGKELLEYCEGEFKRLKREQGKLLKSIKKKKKD